jgi:quinolinate synthase
VDHHDLVEIITKLKLANNALILAHNYQPEDVQSIADFVGDSFELSRIAAESEATLVVFCGVHFMAESAAILAPHKKILLPDINAGCPLADMISVEQLKKIKRKHPNSAVAAYINTSAAVKAESDVCVTSANAVKVVNSLAEETILFVPDGNLAHFVAGRTNKTIIPWPGFCITHHSITAEDVTQARIKHPKAQIIVHPECRPEVVSLADAALGTGGMISYSKNSEANIIIGTEMGMLHRLKKECPEKNFQLLSPKLICHNMKLTTLEKVLTALDKQDNIITVPQQISEKAKLALERMLAVK